LVRSHSLAARSARAEDCPGCDSGFREFVPETELSRGNGCFFPGAPTPVSVSVCRKENSRREWVLGMVPRVLVVPSRLPLIIRGRWLGMVRFSGCDSFVSPSFDFSVSSGPFSTSSCPLSSVFASYIICSSLSPPSFPVD
jgi:hypothetical protein